MARSSSMVFTVAERLRTDALASEDGSLLGSEEALLQRYNVSRPTLRQAASLVAQEQLVTVKRGVGGGYFARRPDANAVSRIAAVYLKAHGARVNEIITAFMPIRIELARLAVQCSDDDLDRLKSFLEREREFGEDISLRTFLVGERKFNSLLGQISGNRALALYLEITLDLAAMVDREEDMYRNHPERVAAMRSERNRLANAIVERDEELAVLAAQRCARMSSRWLLDDVSKRDTKNRDRGGELLEWAQAS